MIKTPQFISCFVFLFCFLVTDAQKKQLNIDSLVNAKPSEYTKVYKTLRPFGRDSLTIDKFLQISKNKDYIYGEAYALNLMGIYCRNISEYDKALNFHKSSLDIARQYNFKELEVVSLNMLGVVYRRKDAVRSALDYHKEALVIAESIKPKSESIKRSIAVSLNSMGNIYLALEQYQLAIERFSKSLKIEEEVQNTLGLAINYHNIGYAKEGLGELDEAMSYYQNSLDYNTQINSTLGIVICNSSIGTLLIQQNKDEEAITLMQSTLKDAKDLRDKFHLASIYTSLGWAYLKTNQLTEAKKYLTQSQELAMEYDFKSNIISNYTYLAAVAEKQNDFKNAFLYTKKSREISDKLNNEQNFQYVNDIIIKYDTEKINDRIRLLESQSEIDQLNYRKKQNILIAGLVTLFLIVVISYILYRQKTLQSEKQILTLEQDILRSQMNPHFVFNSLNSIKQYIISNEQKNAVYYLNKFAKLMRKILDASKTKVVSLAEELETIQLYFSIENIRFSNEIDFKVITDDSVNLNAVKIPSLILQPFLENAIWHGLSSKKGDKKIKLQIEKLSENFILIKVIDNGVGRERSAYLKENKVLKRKSVGLILSRERLTNFVKNYKNKYSLDFVDLKDSNGKASGTEVILKLPTV